MVLADSFYYQPVQIDTIYTRVNAELFAKEGDVNGRGILLTLTENGLMKDTTGIALNLKWEHTSVGNQGVDNFEAVDLSKGLYKITYPIEMLNLGTVRAYIQIIDSGKSAGIRNLRITIERGVGDDTVIVRSDSFTALAQALIDVQSWQGRIDAVEEEKVGGGKLATMADLGQDIKTAMTGGSVAVVGDNTVIESHIVNKQISPAKFVDSYNLLKSGTITEKSIIVGYNADTLLPIIKTGEMYDAHFVSNTKIPNVGKLLIKVSEITAGNAMMILDGTGKRVAHLNLSTLKALGTSYGVVPYGKYFTTYWEIDIAKLRAAYPTVSTLLLQFLTTDREVSYINGIDVVDIFDYEWVNDQHVSDMINDAYTDRVVGYPFAPDSSGVFNNFNYKTFADCVKDIVIYGATKYEQFYIINAHKHTATAFSIAIAKVGYTGGAVGNELVCNAVFNMPALDMTTDKITKFTLSANNQSLKYSAELFINLSEYPTDLPAAGLPSGVLNVANAAISVLPSAIPIHPFSSKATLNTGSYNYLNNAQAIKDIKLYGGKKTDQLYIKNLNVFYSGTYREDCLHISIAKKGYTGGVVGEELVCNAVKPISQIDFVSDKITEFQLTTNNNSGGYWALLYINFKEFLTDSPIATIGNTVMPISNLCIQPNQSELEPTEIILPSKYVVAQGREANLYYDNVMYKNSAAKLRRARVSNFDKYYKDGSRLLASTTKLGDYASSVSLWIDGDSSADYTKSFTLKVVDDTLGSGVTKNILLIGDSLTDSNVIANELATLFSTDVMNINLLGTRGATGKHEGRSGWSMYDYAFFAQGSRGFVDTNPFFNPATSQFDLAYYMANQGYSGVDYVFLNLGTNDAGRTSDANFILSVEAILTSIKSYNANAKVGLWVSPLPSQLEDNQGSKDDFLAFNKKVITAFDNREADGLYLVPVYLNIDLVNDFKTETVAISSRNTATVKRLLDNIHPATFGYLKFADTIFGYIKYFASLG